MFAIPGILGLITFILARFQELSDAFQGFPGLYLFFGLALFGLFVDIRLGITKPVLPPQFPWIVAFSVWCIVTMAARAPGALVGGILKMVILNIIFLVFAMSVQRFSALEPAAGTVLGCALWISLVCAHQGITPFTCLGFPPNASHVARGEPDGRPCHKGRDCLVDPPRPEYDYKCEHAGWFGTTSVGHGRVRYVGILQDPNEISLAVAAALPLAIALYERKKSALRMTLLAVSLFLVTTAVLFSKSRGGQLVLIAVMGTYFVRKFGVKGLILGAVLAAPMMIFGGRKGEGASESSRERLECWYEGMQMFRTYPILGVGFRQFTEHHFLTAHNSYVLTIAELGFPGFWMFCHLLYISTKIPVEAIRRYTGKAESMVAAKWGAALLATCAGVVVGVFFLSFAYHFVLWINLGLTGAFYNCVKAHDSKFEVKVSRLEIGAVTAGCMGIAGLLHGYTTFKVAMGHLALHLPGLAVAMVWR